MSERAAMEPRRVRDRIVGTGEMAERIRAFAWETTRLGAIAEWPSELLTVVNFVLGTPYPVQVLWGPERVLLYNDPWTPLYADRHPEALGRRAAEFWAAAWHLVGDEVDSVFETGVATEHTEVLIPVVREGRLEEVWWDYTYSPVFDGDGRVAGILNISRDVTEARTVRLEKDLTDEALRASQAELLRSHEALKTERGRLMSVWQQAPVFFALLEGPEHRFVLTNPPYRKVIGNREVVGRTVAEALPEAAEQGYTAILDEVVRTGRPFEGRGAVLNLSRGDGLPPEDRILDFTYQPLREEDGTVSGVIVIGVDITENKLAEQALVRNEKLAAVGRLAASIAHEINNPLESVTNLIYLARASVEAGGAADGYLEVAEGELRRVSAIATQTLRFHKQATRAVELTAEMLLESVLQIYRGRMANAGVELRERMRARRPVVCFEGEVRQVLANLVGNAIDAMGGQREARLMLRSADGCNWATGEPGLVVTVADNGPGMTAATISRIFEPFFTTKGIGGTGLGLWISGEIVERHGGSLRVRSAPGTPLRRSGTVFRLFLPYRGREIAGVVRTDAVQEIPAVL